jgi:hypothetical protein
LVEEKGLTNNHTKLQSLLHSFGLIVNNSQFIQSFALIIISKDRIPLIGEGKKEGSLGDTIY